MLSLLPATLMGYIGAVKAGYIILIFLINYRGWVIKVYRIIIIINFVKYISTC